ncbi:MAG: ABC transporter substrate-binding protein [Lachnospiraceae bacterium]
MKAKKMAAIMAAILVTSLVFTGCGSGSTDTASGSEETTEATDDTPEELVVVTWGGALEEAMKNAVEGFEEEYNCKITWDSYTDYSKIQAMVDAGNVYWDVCTIDAYWMYTGADYLEDIDYDLVDKTGIEDYTYDKGVGSYTWATVMSYDSSLYDSESSPQTWTEFFDTEKFPVSRTFYKQAMYLYELALMADGVPKDEIYPIDIDRALAKLDEVKDSVSVWWESGAEPAQLLSSKEVELAGAWAGRITDAKSEGAEVDFNMNEALVTTDVWSVIKGTEHKDLAMEFINYATRAETQAAFSSEVPYGPVNSQAYDLMDAETIQSIPSAPENAELVLEFDPEWWAENYAAADEAFQEWILE